MEESVMLLTILLLLPVILSCLSWRNQMKRPHNGPKLPPGSMGWPFFGETLKLYSQNPSIFFGTRHQRYGDIFKTNIHGSPCVMLTCPEAARFVLVTEAHRFKPSYPQSKERLIGPWAIFFHGGEFHTRMRKLVQGSLSLDAVRTMVPLIEAVAVNTLESCCSGGGLAVNTFHEMKKFTFEVAVLSIFGKLESGYKDKLKDNFFTLDRGYNCFPINLPGTAYRRALLARRRLGKILREIVSEKREKRLTEKNLLSSLLNYHDHQDGQILTDDQIADNIIGVLFAAQDTTASALTWVIKYIHDYPLLRDAIREEQKTIYESNDGGNRPLTWAQTRNMPYTYKVVMESLRMASIISYTYREAVEDVIYNGVLIPKGWKVLPLFRIIHHNPNFFIDPEKFNPSRFEVAQKPNTFVPFGNGVHSCPGNEVAKLEILVFIHHLVNKFRWEVVGPKNGVEYDPFPVPKKGLPAKFLKDS
ncbi:Abscisic acid 8'-hydroxylase 4 [Camellia lanceoleosa]|uniref:Abscisic acid 8'-hydroxylase 4 n=1 Tax=Camellia lanceoleosa TaxID=1840588 RepID=A0ACC0HWC9_9ERIC|nr:Abscisic acid 8'-hydroxylase 4 [Camellia lanceoleosa]